MENLINTFSDQLKEALDIGNNIRISDIDKQYNNIVICGLGGSGIGGTLVNNVLEDEIKIPIFVNKGYTLPAFANMNTLVIISSYSGNTEETLASLEMAIERKCKIVAIASGGKVEEICKNKNFDFIKIPSGHPPRACLGYSMTQVLYVLKEFNLITNQFIKEIESTIKLLVSEKANIKIDAKKLSDNLINKTPIIYSANNFEAVAIRFRQQINENSKMLCWHHVVPEMNHNELVGWRIEDKNQAVIFLRNKSDLPRIQERMELNKTIISKCTTNIYEIWSKGNSNLEKALYLIHLTDWVSLYLSYLRKVDTTEVKVIEFLKGELAKK